MTYRLRITDEAAEQLLSIARWYAETAGSQQIAAVWYDGFLAALDSLRDSPWRGALAPEHGLFACELRELHYGSGKRTTHRALYRVVANDVEIIAIRHHAQRPLQAGDLEV